MLLSYLLELLTEARVDRPLRTLVVLIVSVAFGWYGYHLYVTGKPGEPELPPGGADNNSSVALYVPPGTDPILELHIRADGNRQSVSAFSDSTPPANCNIPFVLELSNNAMFAGPPGLHHARPVRVSAPNVQL